jgi:hypothetical protein
MLGPGVALASTSPNLKLAHIVPPHLLPSARVPRRSLLCSLPLLPALCDRPAARGCRSPHRHIRLTALPPPRTTGHSYASSDSRLEFRTCPAIVRTDVSASSACGPFTTAVPSPSWPTTSNKRNSECQSRIDLRHQLNQLRTNTSSLDDTRSSKSSPAPWTSSGLATPRLRSRAARRGTLHKPWRHPNSTSGTPVFPSK